MHITMLFKKNTYSKNLDKLALRFKCSFNILFEKINIGNCFLFLVRDSWSENNHGWANGRISLQVYRFYSRRSCRMFSVHFGGHYDEPISCRFVSISSKPKKHNSNYRNFSNLDVFVRYCIAYALRHAYSECGRHFVCLENWAPLFDNSLSQGITHWRSSAYSSLVHWW